MSDNPGALLLMAAGGARRMLQPKQLLPVDGQPLLRRVVQGLAAAPVRPFLVVLGANYAAIAATLMDLPIETVENTAWPDGLGVSIRVGMGEVVTLAPEAPWVIIGLGDQPLFTAHHVGLLRDEHSRSGRGIVATRCDGVLMPPMLFARRYFGQLSQLEGDTGAREVVNSHREDLSMLDVTGWVDLDTPEDYAGFIQRSSR